MQRLICSIFTILLISSFTKSQTDSLFNVNTELGIPEIFNSVFFVNEDTGWIAGSYGTLLRTSDGGCTWEHRDLLPDQDLKKIYFKDAEFGWLFSRDSLLYTTNAGNNWNGINTPGYLTSVYMKDTSHIWIGRSNSFSRSTNGGQSWILIAYYGMYDIYFFDDLNVWGVGTYYVKSTDGGITFTAVGPTLMYDSYFAYTDTIWTAGEMGDITKVSSSPWNISYEPTNTTNDLMSIDFYGGLSLGYCVGKNRTILYSTNRGEEWINRPYPYPTDFYSVQIINPGNIWIAGDEVILTNHTGVFNISVNDTTVTTGTNLEMYCKARAIPHPEYHLEEFPDNMMIDNLTGRIQWTASPVGDYPVIVAAENDFGSMTDTFYIHVTPLSSVDETPAAKDFMLSCFPNPFNPSTKITFAVPLTSVVTIKLFDVLGNELTTLVNKEEFSPGKHTLIWNAQGYPSGIYICALTTGNFRKLMKLVLMK